MQRYVKRLESWSSISIMLAICIYILDSPYSLWTINPEERGISSFWKSLSMWGSLVSEFCFGMLPLGWPTHSQTTLSLSIIHSYFIISCCVNLESWYEGLPWLILFSVLLGIPLVLNFFLGVCFLTSYFVSLTILNGTIENGLKNFWSIYDPLYFFPSALYKM